jgi:hypothetical protein
LAIDTGGGGSDDDSGSDGADSAGGGLRAAPALARRRTEQTLDRAGRRRQQLSDALDPGEDPERERRLEAARDAALCPGRCSRWLIAAPRSTGEAAANTSASAP